MGSKDKNYNIENLMISFRALTPILLIICTSLVGYLVVKIDNNTRVLSTLDKNISNITIEKQNLDRRVSRLEHIFDTEFKRSN